MPNLVPPGVVVECDVHLPYMLGAGKQSQVAYASMELYKVRESGLDSVGGPVVSMVRSSHAPSLASLDCPSIAACCMGDWLTCRPNAYIWQAVSHAWLAVPVFPCLPLHSQVMRDPSDPTKPLRVLLDKMEMAARILPDHIFTGTPEHLRAAMERLIKQLGSRRALAHDGLTQPSFDGITPPSSRAAVRADAGRVARQAGPRARHL